MLYCDGCAEKNGWPKTIFKSMGICEDCKETNRCNDMPSNKLPPSNKIEALRCQICGSNNIKHMCQDETFLYGTNPGKEVIVSSYESIKCNHCGESVGFPESVKRAEELLKKARDESK